MIGFKISKPRSFLFHMHQDNNDVSDFSTAALSFFTGKKIHSFDWSPCVCVNVMAQNIKTSYFKLDLSCNISFEQEASSKCSDKRNVKWIQI